MYIADLHIHSKYSRATSRDCDLAHLDISARLKGLQLIGTGDFSHPAWRSEMHSQLEPTGDGLYMLRPENRLSGLPANAPAPRFVISGEISTIYKKDGKTRKVHHLILLPSLEAAEELSRRLELIGNIRSDGRPILGLDSRDLAEITFDAAPDAIFIPAHIWTPHFSLFGAFSDFSTIEECYGDMTRHIFALETGLSSDPPMNRQLSALDKYQLVSNSDAHSPAKLAREANILDGAVSYPALKRALETDDGLCGTIEFFPEEGKYHLDGHRACKCRLEPAETRALDGRCPVCGRKVTVGVQHRVDALADRPLGSAKDHFESLMPLEEVIADCMGVSPASKKVRAAYENALSQLGSELHILREASLSDIDAACGPLVAEAMRRLRVGEVIREAGYDGEYGHIALFHPGEQEIFLGQTTFISQNIPTRKKKAPEPVAAPVEAAAIETVPENPEQLAAICDTHPHIAVIAGPGTGKTYTLVERVAHMISEMGIKPTEITAVTFTNQAAAELHARLEAKLGKRAVKGLTVGTFHSVCLSLIPKIPIAGRPRALDIISPILKERGDNIPPAQCLDRISAIRNGVQTDPLPDGLIAAYREALHSAGLRDMDDILEDALETDSSAVTAFKNLLVDEYQDINALQRALVTHWLPEDGTLFVIGDPDQSIYGFRGASADCFDELTAQLPDLHRITLKNNYRSTPEVITAALSVIRKNPGAERLLMPVRKSGVSVRRAHAPDDASEAAFIAREISRMTGGIDMNSSSGTSALAFSDIAVICRTRRQLMRIEETLSCDGIPCMIVGHDETPASEAVQGALGFIRSVASPADESALRDALSKLWHVREDDIARAASAYRDNAGNPDALEASLGGCAKLRPWLDALKVLAPKFPKEKPRKLISGLAKITGAKLDPLLDAALFYPTVAALIEGIDTGSEGDIRRICSNSYASGAVTLMTMHGSKGLEFPAVFLAGLTAGTFPSERSTDIREERRLFFVGITRARDELIISCAGEPSCFMGELPSDISVETCARRRTEPVYEQLSFL